MPGTFRSKNGATLSGHSDKWSNPNRSARSHEAGQGSKGKRNQGTGIQGKLNTLPSDSVDTSKMNPDEKLKYFKSLGLMPGKGVAPAEQPPAKEVPQEPKRNQVQELSNNLGKIFKEQPELLQDIVKQLQQVPKENFKQKVVDVLKVMQDNTSTNPQEIHGAIMSVLDDKEPKRTPVTDSESYRRMTPEDFINGNDDLPKSTLLSLVKQAQQFDDVGGALYYINMARDNIEDNEDKKSIISSMHATADSLSDLGFDLK